MYRSSRSRTEATVHRRDAENAEKTPKKTFIRSLRTLCDLCASAVENEVFQSKRVQIQTNGKANEMKPAGKVAVVTGGASGLGEACVRRLIAEGTKVLIMDMDEARGNKLAAEMGPGSALFAKVDVTSPEEVRHALESARAVLRPMWLPPWLMSASWEWDWRTMQARRL